MTATVERMGDSSHSSAVARACVKATIKVLVLRHVCKCAFILVYFARFTFFLLLKQVRKPYTITKQRERWTEEEHALFLEALDKHGRAWGSIQRTVDTRNF